MTHVDDPRLSGRVPEFSRQSNRPGIGAGYMEAVAEKLRDIGYSDEDVPNSLRHGNRLLPLGRYLVRRLRRELGREESAPQSTLDKVAEEVWSVRVAARHHPEGFRGALRDATEGQRASLIGRTKLRKVWRKI